MLVFLQIFSNADSTLLAKLESISNELHIIEKKVTVFPWIPITASIVTGLLVWGGQYLDRKAKRSQELKNELDSLLTKCELLVISLKNVLRELASKKNLRSYWWYCYLDEFNAGDDKDEENEKKYFSDHHTVSNEILSCTLKMGDLLCEYYSVASKFKLLSGATTDITVVKKLITETDLANAKSIAPGLDNEQALDEYEKNSRELAAVYYREFEVLDTINESLKTSATK